MNTYVEMNIKVVPGSSRTQLAGWLDSTLKIKVTAPPEKGKANKEVCQLIAQVFHVSKKDVSIVSGHTSAYKVLRITSNDLSSIHHILDKLK